MWKLVATHFKDEPNVIGYELLNEPFFGDVKKNPLLYLNSDKVNLQPFWNILAKKIREVDNSSLIYFEPSVFY